MLHKNISAVDRHAVHCFEYADAAARTGATGFIAADVFKLALQLDDKTVWMLTATTPTWVLLVGGRSYDHTQSVASTTWTVAHNLGRYPGVMVTDHLGEVITADVKYIDNNTVRITHATALIGCVYCN